MSIIQITCLFAVVAAFAVFAVVLAWGDYQTRNIRHVQSDTPRPTAAPQFHLRDAETAAVRIAARPAPADRELVD